MTPNKKKMMIMAIVLLAVIFYWITKLNTDALQTMLSIFTLSLAAYFLGRFHGEEIYAGKIRAGDFGPGQPGSSPLNRGMQ